MKKFMILGMTMLSGTSLFAASVDDQVLEIMEEMGAAKKLKRYAKKKDYKNPEFKKYGLELIEQYNKMKGIKHSEAMFNDFNAKMLAELESFKKVLEGNDYDAIADSWAKVGAECKACHEEYK